VHGKPFAGWQLSWLAHSGIDSVVYSIGHLGDDVRAYVGDGSPWGLSVVYVDDGEHLRGTAGALRLALDSGVLEDDFLVLYGDSWLQVDPVAVLQSLRARPEPALMTVHRNEGQWDTSNVIFDGHRVVCYAKGLSKRPPEMCWIDYGLTALRGNVLAERVPSDTVSDLAPVLSALAAEGQLAGYEVADRFYEIGSPQGRAELETLLSERPPR
jgi:NDP-sugar pyrophosphorylase family protein